VYTITTLISLFSSFTDVGPHKKEMKITYSLSFLSLTLFPIFFPDSQYTKMKSMQSCNENPQTIYHWKGIEEENTLMQSISCLFHCTSLAPEKEFSDKRYWGMQKVLMLATIHCDSVKSKATMEYISLRSSDDA
jgi:hypothetical protein